ncbi:pancreatic lipase-related protein 2 isoform X1 [Acyrthosiphon pisum]|uniref:Lipase domain-containing protein n=2 Tax=Acyrthosiphon pisum TaxID=7029 RepID=A0A8R1W1V0_ACYPI|nr:pancreatic lipase-related protein 2 isoform X1 [Acyrthosiphon pisum]|eukprot:XP_001949067.2 PREDICTED: pancreatic lipase-related protein 2-like isoform X1 [Acyrthosiphon pisum]
MITASKYFASCGKVMLLAIFILKYGIVLQSESAHAIDYLVKNQDPTFKEVYFFNDKYKIYNMSNRVFYWLYTREQPKGQLLNRSDPNMIKSTNFNVENPTKILVHDWLGSFYEKECFCAHIVEAYLLVGAYNVICVDWMQFSFDIMYSSAKINVKYIGYDIAKVLNILSNDMSVGSENIHLIGHGLGAHIVGYTGKKLSGKISRITGLDPAMQLYENTDPKYRINKNDATFVDIIHTNGNGLGLFEPLGHIDFYPNGGNTQTNCKILDRVSGGACSHAKAFDYFARSILARKECKALQCTKWSEYEAGECGEFAKSTYMGEHVDKNQTGIYYL